MKNMNVWFGGRIDVMSPRPFAGPWGGGESRTGDKGEATFSTDRLMITVNLIKGSAEGFANGWDILSIKKVEKRSAPPEQYNLLIQISDEIYEEIESLSLQEP